MHQYLSIDPLWTPGQVEDEEAYQLKVVVDTLTNCGRWMIVMSNLVPISLIVTVETVRFIQGMFMQWDIDMVDMKTGVQAGVSSSNLNESLGQVDYIFSDKTGTLTKNYMEFKKMSIGTYSYGLDCGYKGRGGDDDFERADDDDILVDKDDGVYSTLNSMGDAEGPRSTTNFNFFDPEFEQHLGDPAHPNHRDIVNFLTHLAVCHTVVI